MSKNLDRFNQADKGKSDKETKGQRSKDFVFQFSFILFHSFHLNLLTEIMDRFRKFTSFLHIGFDYQIPIVMSALPQRHTSCPSFPSSAALPCGMHMEKAG